MAGSAGKSDRPPLHLEPRQMAAATTIRDCRDCGLEILIGDSYVLVNGRRPYHRDCYRSASGRSQRRSEIELRGKAAIAGQPRRIERAALYEEGGLDA